MNVLPNAEFKIELIEFNMLSRRIKKAVASLSKFIRQPKRRWQQLQIGVGIFFLALTTFFVAAYLQWQWLFHVAVIIFTVAVLFVLPAYLALLIWRLTEKPEDKNS